MVDEETLQNQYGGDPLEAYRYISDDFTDSPASFSNSEKVVKVEIIKQPESLCEHHKGSGRAIIDGVEHWQCMKCKEWKV
jgi:hypothetical protein